MSHFVPASTAEEELRDLLVASYLTDLAALRWEARMQPALSAAAEHFPASPEGLSPFAYVGKCLLAMRENGGIAAAVPAVAEMVAKRAPGRAAEALMVATLFV